ncbi:MAG: hypothetical protein ACLQVL_37795 [Terriglobia bacterium]
MRFILQDDVSDRLPRNWDDLVNKAKAYVEAEVATERAKAVAAGKSPEEIEKLTLAARHKAINARSSVWRAAAEALGAASYEKCWYCECRQERSDMPVDHFRPKNNVLGEVDHPGYWWLAFDWKNYRYSCTYCNSMRRDVEGGTSGGKHDYFPIIPPPPHARCETDPKDRAKLLDPTDDDDTKLLTFLPNGFPRPAKDDPVSIDRVLESVRLYHLDHRPLVNRRKRIADEISQHVNEANAAFAIHNDTGYKLHKTEVIKRVRANADFSTAARVYLQAYRTYQWVEEILGRDL